MKSIAILIGNATYERENDLPFCANDVEAVRELVEATGRFEPVFSSVDLDADGMRELVRRALPPELEYSEVLFYFSGHGAQASSE